MKYDAMGSRWPAEAIALWVQCGCRSVVWEIAHKVSYRRSAPCRCGQEQQRCSPTTRACRRGMQNGNSRSGLCEAVETRAGSRARSCSQTSKVPTSRDNDVCVQSLTTMAERRTPDVCAPITRRHRRWRVRAARFPDPSLGLEDALPGRDAAITSLAANRGPRGDRHGIQAQKAGRLPTW